MHITNEGAPNNKSYFIITQLLWHTPWAMLMQWTYSHLVHQRGNDANPFTVTLENVIRGHHVFNQVWTQRLEERLCLRPEKDSSHDASLRRFFKTRNLLAMYQGKTESIESKLSSFIYALSRACS